MATGTSAASPIVSSAIGALELVFDPRTRDLIDAPDGWFVEGTDSRSAVLWWCCAERSRAPGHATASTAHSTSCPGSMLAMCRARRTLTFEQFSRMAQFHGELQPVLEALHRGTGPVVRPWTNMVRDLSQACNRAEVPRCRGAPRTTCAARSRAG